MCQALRLVFRLELERGCEFGPIANWIGRFGNIVIRSVLDYQCNIIDSKRILLG